MHTLHAALLGASLTPPETRRDDITEIICGMTVADPYRWLEDQQAPETREWIDRQNAHARAWLDEIPFRDALRQQLEGLLRMDVVSPPSIRGDRRFLWKKRADQELMVLYTSLGDGDDEVLLDPHTMSDDLTTTVTTMGLSEDGSLLAYGIRKGGEDEVEIRFLDVEARQDLPLVMPRDRYAGVSFLPDKSGFYYSIYGGDAPRVYYREIDPDADSEEIFGQGYGAGVLVGAGLSEDGRWLVIHVFYGSAAKKSEVYLKDVANGGPVVPVVNDLEARFSASVGGDWLYLWTNWEAPNSRVFRVNPETPTRENWQEIIPEKPDAVLEGGSLVGGQIANLYLENVVSRVELCSPDGVLLGTLTGPTIGSLSGLGGRWSQDTAYYSFTSYHVPSTVYTYDIQTGQSEVYWQADVPFDPDLLEVTQEWYTSRDGTRIPMFVCARRDLPRDGERPVYLTGYGGFNASVTPGFSAVAAIWAASGGIFAQPNLRGGGEFGETWHEAGMKERKQNVFDDFITAAEHLVAGGWTNPRRIAIAGGSNGGLLVGAVMTQRPDLYRAVLCTYPLLDMVRYHKFLVAHFWVPEYGSADVPDEFPYLYAYSPYHRVSEGGEYPAVLFMTGDADTRVDPLHARKMAALVQARQGAPLPVLLHYETKAGHSGGKPLSKVIDDTVDSLGFLMSQTGLTPAG